MRSKLIRLAAGVAVLATVGIGLAACQSDAPAASSTSKNPSAGGDEGKNGKCDWPETHLKIGGGVTGGLYFLMGAELQKIVDDDVPCADATTTTGSPVDLLRDNVDVTFTQPDSLYAAYTGDGGQGFQKGEKFDYLTGGVMWLNQSMFFARGDSSLNSLDQVKDSDVVGVASSNTVKTLQDLFALMGKHPQFSVIDDYEQLYGALRSGQVTLVHDVRPHPASIVLEAENNGPIKAVYYPKSVLPKFQKEYPDYEITTIKAGQYDFMKKDYVTWGRRGIFIFKKDVNKALAERITKIFYEDTAQFEKVTPNASVITLDTLKLTLKQGTLRVPFHPGAAAYFKSVGVDVDTKK